MPADFPRHRPVGAGRGDSDTVESGTRSGGNGPIIPTENLSGEEKAVLNRESFMEALGDNVALMTLMRVGSEEEHGERGGVAHVMAAAEAAEGAKVAKDEEEEEEEGEEAEAKLHLLVSGTVRTRQHFTNGGLRKCGSNGFCTNNRETHTCVLKIVKGTPCLTTLTGNTIAV